MTQQVEAETQAWYAARSGQRTRVAIAMVTGDFSAVPTQPYAQLPQGDWGFPVSAAMEAELHAAYQSSPVTLTGDTQISTLSQVNVLESFRRMYLSQKQRKREVIAHWVAGLNQAPAYDNLLLQTFTGTAKVTPSK